MKIHELAEEYNRLDALRDDLEAQKSEAWKRQQEVAKELISMMDTEQMSQFKDNALGKTFSVATDFNIKQVDEDAFWAWVKENGHGDAIKMTIHAATRAAIVKDHMAKTGQDVPGIEAKPYQKIVMRKASVNKLV